jgi:nuclear GTP-binding protein
MPPARNQGEPSEAKIVSELGKEFNIDEVYNGESSFIGSLKSADDYNPVEVPPSCPLNFDEKLIEVCVFLLVSDLRSVNILRL